MELHKNIKELRKHKGLRQEELAELMGVSTASVSKWETDQCAPELTVLMELADYFEVSVDALMGHQILGNRLTSMLDEMEQLIESGTYKDAIEVAEKLLQCYPNSLEVIEKAADLYYEVYVSTADAALLWGCEVLENITGDAVAHLMPIKSTMYVMLAIFAEEREEKENAEAFVKKAMLSVDNVTDAKEKYDFLSCTKAGKIIGTTPSSPEMIVQMLKATGLTRLAEVAENALNE